MRMGLRQMQRVLYYASLLMLIIAYEALCILPKIGSDYCLGYEAKHWSIECRFGRLTLYSWTTAGSADSINRKGQSLPALHLLTAPSLGWFAMWGPDACSRRATITYTDVAGRVARSTGGYPPTLERWYLHLCYPIGGLLGAQLIIGAYIVLKGQRRRRTTRMRILCPNCAYDLRGNASGICPECGQPAQPSRLVSRLDRAGSSQIKHTTQNSFNGNAYVRVTVVALLSFVAAMLIFLFVYQESLLDPERRSQDVRVILTSIVLLSAGASVCSITIRTLVVASQRRIGNRS